MSTIDPKRWATQVRKLNLPDIEPAEFLAPPPAPPGSDPLTHHAVFGLLLWESSTQEAAAALKRILGVVVDYNELRVSRVDDIASWLGEKFPLAAERAMRLRATLSDIYSRQQTVQLSPMLLGSKKDTTQALAALEGITPFAVARVMALGLGRHAVPVDGRLLALLQRTKVATVSETSECASSQLAALTPEEGLIDVLARLQAWSDVEGTPAERKSEADLSKKASGKGTGADQQSVKDGSARRTGHASAHAAERVSEHETDRAAKAKAAAGDEKSPTRKGGARGRTTRRLRP